ncbi:DUF2730 family protein [Rhodoferax sp.]|uniref:DUF2730 family protein n=1 Tax=Rhodoferax sp. TaxID=50421 RepID=UPI0026273718|nr:DUF2730 family protein [Rhodoferax sp.]MDD2811057.1 DUF2730 family protein [Rhodoferax sp.]
MTFTELVPYFVVANFGLSWATAFYVHLSSKNKATNDRLERLEAAVHTALALHAERLSQVEATLRVVPTHDDLGKLYRELNETTQQVSRLSGEISQMNDNLRMLLHHMGERKADR